jgi:neutral ceramidase
MNPAAERALYLDGDTDKLMTTLRFENDEGKELGMLSWFAVHPNCLPVTNHFISGDNKGFASYMFEKKKREAGLPGFVAAFGQSNEGDSSPHLGPQTCPDGKTLCTKESTCQGKAQLCSGKGPGDKITDCVKIIGIRQMNAAWELYNDVEKSTVLRGSVDYRHKFVDMTKGTTCRPAMGISFPAGSKSYNL